MLGGAAEVAHGLAHEHHAKNAMLGTSLFKSLAGAFELDEAMDECREGKMPDCILDSVGAATSTADGLVGMAKGAAAGAFGKVLGSIGTGLSVIEAIRAARDGDVMGVVEHGGEALLGALGLGEAAPIWSGTLAVGTGLSEIGERDAKRTNRYGGHRGYTDKVADDALDHWAPAYDVLPAWYVHAMAAPEVLKNGAKEGLKSGAMGVVHELQDGPFELAKAMQNSLRAQAFDHAQHAPSEHRWKLDNPLAPIQANACYEQDDPHSILQAFGHYTD